jgi:RNA polymerase sigma-70 factor, ECF subfamily
VAGGRFTLEPLQPWTTVAGRTIMRSVRTSRPDGVVDDAALRRLWEEHAAALLSFALQLTGGDRGTAEDVVQETLLRAWRNGDALDPSRGPARPWLLTVARRVVIDHHRARGARPSEVDDRGLAGIGVEDGVDAALDAWLVTDALATLTPEHREALVQTYYAGRTVRETATLLGVPPGTVKSRVFYGLRALKVALDERGVS